MNWEDDEYDEEYEEGRGRGRKRGRCDVKHLLDDEAEVDSEVEDEDDDQEIDDDFIVEGGADLPEEDDDDDGGRMRSGSRMLPHFQEDHEDIEAMERTIQERYGRYLTDYDEETQDIVEQQALLPSVRDPKLWMVKCAIGRERETAVCLMQKYMSDSELRILSAIALDHLKNYIYVEADKEAHVREACKGLSNILGQKILLVPIREMTDVLSVESKSVDLARDTWVRMKIGTYKGDLAKVVDVDSVRQRVTVKLIPRLDLQALANKLEGKEVVKKKAFVPPPRFMNVDEARVLHIRVEHRYDAYGERFVSIGGMMFKDGFLYKTVSRKSICVQNINPTFDEHEKFGKLGETRDADILFANRKKGNFMKGSSVIVVKGDLKNMKGWVEKVDKDNVYVRPAIKGLPNIVAVKENELCNYFEPGNHVKVVSGVQEGVTGLVVKVEQNVIILISDSTKEHIRVFADDITECSEPTASIIPAHIPQSPQRFSRQGPPIDSGRKHKGGRRKDGLAGATVKVRQGPYKGSRGRVIGVKGTLVRIELESQMKVVMVDRNHISDNVAATASRDTSQYGMGSETPMHPSRTPFNPYMTPMRDPGATDI
ncbi:putative transcription elongation factor SPT5 homolog 1 [Gastrolobium bilobum]|uniref:putative transcription elongation factor SPT5 homolog 1 n=1 Tax=Gastrolobium bilobum TaxID=150636 RepID=UPI002AB30603|nr:putative transcription elongation factor SPT5 homolog 1 [Gastrolobium bilobum]